MLTEYNNLTKKWKIHVVHHTHTDIGYTDSQEIITDRQIDFIKQAIEISEAFASGEKNNWRGFKWICEAFWAVDRFWEQADDAWKERFRQAVLKGDIELTGNYLNLCEAIDEDTLNHFASKARNFADELSVPMESAMTADINGYSWGYAQVLFDAGIRNFMSNTHNHHGMFPLFKKQVPFYWETPKGDKLLVWNGDHYQVGNEMGIVPGATHSYIIQDKLTAHSNMDPEKEFKLSEIRIYRYLKQLESEGYPLDFVPLNVTGLLTDNAPPNARIMDFINRWNQKYAEKVTIEMTTLDNFFETLKNSGAEIETFRGDWPDWWSDGMGSSLKFTKTLRQAQRSLKAIREMDADNEIMTKAQLDAIYYNIMLGSEHTFSYSSSMEEPWADNAFLISNQKLKYAVEANQLTDHVLNKIKLSKGEVILRSDRSMIFKAVNPYRHTYSNTFCIYIDRWEKTLLAKGFEVIDVATGKPVPSQLNNVARGMEIFIQVTLGPSEEKTFAVKPVSDVHEVTTISDYLVGVDRVFDIKNVKRYCPVTIDHNFIETNSYRIEWSLPGGISSLYDKTIKKQLIRPDCLHNAFTPVYEITPLSMGEDICNVRKDMGRNRKGQNVKRFAGRLKSVNIINTGTLFSDIDFIYELEGTTFYSMILRVFHDIAKINVSIRVNKDSVWEPENLYVSLPFGLNNGQLWLEKLGAVLQPGRDQLPGTNIDYYCIQEGFGYLGEEEWLAISTPDTPLVQLGTLEYVFRELNEDHVLDEQPVYSWTMNNYWETNFDASSGGFHQIRYSLSSGKGSLTPLELIQNVQDLCGVAPCFRIEG